jgi:hypothetical protein
LQIARQCRTPAVIVEVLRRLERHSDRHALFISCAVPGPEVVEQWVDRTLDA